MSLLTFISAFACCEAFSLVLSRLSLLPGDMTAAVGRAWDDVIEATGFRNGAVSVSSRASERRWAFEGCCFSAVGACDARDVIGLGITDDFGVCGSTKSTAT